MFVRRERNQCLRLRIFQTQCSLSASVKHHKIPKMPGYRKAALGPVSVRASRTFARHVGRRPPNARRARPRVARHVHPRRVVRETRPRRACVLERVAGVAARRVAVRGVRDDGSGGGGAGLVCSQREPQSVSGHALHGGRETRDSWKPRLNDVTSLIREREAVFTQEEISMFV